MKIIISMLVIAALISGCGNTVLLAKKSKTITNEIQIWDQIACLPDEKEPFTGNLKKNILVNNRNKQQTFWMGRKMGYRPGGIQVER
jgi:flagellar basal body-associated protein FliL